MNHVTSDKSLELVPWPDSLLAGLCWYQRPGASNLCTGGVPQPGLCPLSIRDSLTLHLQGRGSRHRCCARQLRAGLLAKRCSPIGSTLTIRAASVWSVCPLVFSVCHSDRLVNVHIRALLYWYMYYTLPSHSCHLRGFVFERKVPHKNKTLLLIRGNTVPNMAFK